jgi:hypothetical protein
MKNKIIKKLFVFFLFLFSEQFSKNCFFFFWFCFGTKIQPNRPNIFTTQNKFFSICKATAILLAADPAGARI